MTTIASIEYIEIVDKELGREARIAGTKIGVDEIVSMHIRNHSSVEWIVENFEVLSHAKIYAALAYYYDHQAEVDAIIDRPVVMPEDAMTLDDLKAKIKTRQ